MKTLYTFYADAARIVLQSIFAHKLRAFLTLIGIIIGVASVVIVGAAISGLNTYVMEKVTAVLGVNHFMIARMAHQGELSEDAWEKMNRRNKRLELEDYDWVRDYCVACSEVGAQLQNQTDLKQNGEELFGVAVQGVTPNMQSIEDKTIAEGRFIMPQEIETAAMVMVIGDEVKEKFFPGQDPIGKTLNVRGLPLTIIGIEEKRGSMLGQSFDKQMYIPLTTYRKIFGGRQSLQIHGKAAAREKLQTVIEDARTSLRNKHKLKGNEDDDFGLVNTADLAGEVDSLTGGIAAVVVPITFISLVVGGIVVMNIMLVSVTERTQEIGIRKAIGARRRDIVLQFLYEAMTLTFLGGIIGVLSAIAISKIIAFILPALPSAIPLWAVIAGLLVSVFVGLVFGVWPARKASRLDPIECLRYE